MKMTYLVQIVIKLVVGFGNFAVNIVPPVTNKDFLVEHGPSRTHETVLAPIKMAVMVDLNKQQKRKL